LCKNFHNIHSELLEIFYSYIQQYNHSQTNIKIVFFLITENISFIPNTILNSSHILRVKRPSVNEYRKLMAINEQDMSKPFIQRISTIKQTRCCEGEPTRFLEHIDIDGVVNIKETRSFSLLENSSQLPEDVFNLICNNIIKDISCPQKIEMTGFRDKLYDILTYNLDMNECLWYIIKHFITHHGEFLISENEISEIIQKTYSFLKYFNNNYRPIFHLESMMYCIINKIHKYGNQKSV